MYRVLVSISLYYVCHLILSAKICHTPPSGTFILSVSGHCHYQGPAASLVAMTVTSSHSGSDFPVQWKHMSMTAVAMLSMHILVLFTWVLDWLDEAASCL